MLLHISADRKMLVWNNCFETVFFVRQKQTNNVWNIITFYYSQISRDKKK